MYKLILSILFLINVNYILAGSNITEYLTFDLIRGQFYGYNVTNGQQIYNTNIFQGKYYFIDGALGSDGKHVYFISYDTSSSGDNSDLLQYSLDKNEFKTLVKVKGDRSVGMVEQVYAYDPVHNLAAVVGLPQNAMEYNLTMCIWDFNAKTTSTIYLDVIVNLYVGNWPTGTYDASTGNYYILYNDLKGNAVVSIYNLPSRKVVETLTLTGPRTSYLSIFYGGGQIILQDNSKTAYRFYTIDTTTNTYNVSLEIPCNFESKKVNPGPIVSKDGYIVVMVAPQPNQYSFVTVELGSLKTITTTPISTYKHAEDLDIALPN